MECPSRCLGKYFWTLFKEITWKLKMLFFFFYNIHSFTNWCQTVCGCASLWTFHSHLAFRWWNCFSFVLTRPVPSHQASVMETVSVACSHLSLTHKTLLRMCALSFSFFLSLSLIHTHRNHLCSPTTSCLFVSSHDCQSQPLRWTDLRWDIKYLMPWTALKMNTRAHT